MVDNAKQNGVLGTLAKSTDRWVQLGTLALVAVSGLTSTCQTNQLSRQSLEDRDKAVRQINQLYNRIDDFESRQRQVLNNQRDMLDLLRKHETH